MEIFSFGWLPVGIILLGIIIILSIDYFKRENARDGIIGTTTLILVAAALSTIFAKTQYASTYNGTDLFFFGNFYMTFSIIGLLASIIVVFVAWKDLSLELDLGVFFSLLLLANIGGIVIAASRNLISLYIGYELVSLPSYAMVAFKKRSKLASEASLKIFLLGALSSAMIVYGLALYYGATGSFLMSLAFTQATQRTGIDGLKYAAVVLIVAGSGFKIGLVPFHFWIADVYNGAPLSVVTFLAAASKKMAFAFVFQLFFVAMPMWNGTWGPIFAILATLSMLLGNLAAVTQTTVMRILAYSTIAQAGYIVIAIAAYAQTTDITIRSEAINGALFHIIAHVLMKGAALAATFLVIDTYGNSNLENFRGLIHKNRLVGGSFAIALFSLMGIPPLAGFFGKFFLFFAAVHAGLLWLAIVGLVGSAISIFYYTKIIRVMMDKPTDNVEIKTTTPINVMLVLLTLMTIFLFLMGNQISNLATAIAKELPV